MLDLNTISINVLDLNTISINVLDLNTISINVLDLNTISINYPAKFRTIKQILLLWQFGNLTVTNGPAKKHWRQFDTSSTL